MRACARKYMCVTCFAFAGLSAKQETACKKRPRVIVIATIYPAVAERCYVAVCAFVAFVAASTVVAKVPIADLIDCAFRRRRNPAVCSHALHKHRIHDRRNSRRKTFWTTVETQSCPGSVPLSACPPVLPEPFPWLCHYCHLIRIASRRTILLHAAHCDSRV